MSHTCTLDGPASGVLGFRHRLLAGRDCIVCVKILLGQPSTGQLAGRPPSFDLGGHGQHLHTDSRAGMCVGGSEVCLHLSRALQREGGPGFSPRDKFLPTAASA